jgi:hypothetical protein
VTPVAVSIDTMLRKVTLLLATALPALVIAVGTSVSAAQPGVTIVPGCTPPFLAPFLGPEKYSLWVRACGPSHVVENRNYTYGAVVKNYGKMTFRKLKLSVLHYDPITRSSRPYRRERRGDLPPPMMASVWTLNNFKPGQFFRVNITLAFQAAHRCPAPRCLTQSHFTIEGRGYGPHEIVGRTKYVVFIKK